MNYLAHAYLSFDQPAILAGNMISDFIKGKKQFDYPADIRRGIVLHRSIDEFTDSHEVTKQAKIFFKPAYGLYAGAFMDVVYDHFLAKDVKEFPGDSLALFAKNTYKQLLGFDSVFPEPFLKMFYYMRTQNWLFNYQFKEMISNSFRGLVGRATFLNDYHPAVEIFENNYESLRNYYASFFPELKQFTFQKLEDLF